MKRGPGKVIGTCSKGKADVASALGCDELIVLDEVPGASYEDYESVDIVTRVMEVTDGKGCKAVIDGIGKSTNGGTAVVTASVRSTGEASDPPCTLTITFRAAPNTVPVLAAAGGVVWLDEAATPRGVAAAALVLGGVAVALLAGARSAAKARR